MGKRDTDQPSKLIKRLNSYQTISSSAPSDETNSNHIPMDVRKITQSLPDSELALRTIAMPVFANAHGDILGGWLLSQMDLAAAPSPSDVPMVESPLSRSRR